MMGVSQWFPAVGLLFALSETGAQAPVLTRDFSIGCESCGGGEQFSRPLELAADASGALLVADRDPPLLRVFDAAGRLRWQGGVKGSGPGEFQRILRAALLPDGSIIVVDLGAMRVTTLDAQHAPRATVSLSRLPTTAATDGTDRFLVAGESPTGTRFEWSLVEDGAVTPLATPPLDSPDQGATYRLPSVALAGNGTMAVIPNAERYRIVRLDASGGQLPDLTHDVARVRRTAKEDSILTASVNRELGAVAAMARGRGLSGALREAGPGVDRTFKAHFAVDGLRYDPAGRLWAQTMRGDETRTIFDVFSASGTFLGSVTVDGNVTAFALSGRWLFTAVENVNGIPQVTRWTVR